VPRGTPRPVVSQLESAIRITASSPEFIAQSEKLGVRPAFLPAEEFSALVAKEDAELSRLMQKIGLKK
jgi:tripartite-type tricarboxylate transporter receptor subunit TctC